MKAATAIILAAERDPQMNSAKPTALHEVAGRPMIDWMLAAFEGCVETPPVIVDGSQQMIAAHVGARARTAVQQEALGDADALRAARARLKRRQWAGFSNIRKLSSDQRRTLRTAGGRSGEQRSRRTCHP